MSKIAESIIKYKTTTSHCECPDRRFRQRVCKHMLSLFDAMEIMEAKDMAERNAGGYNPNEIVRVEY